MQCFRHLQHARDHSLVLLARRRVVELASKSQLLGVFLLGCHSAAEYFSGSFFFFFLTLLSSRVSNCRLRVVVQVACWESGGN